MLERYYPIKEILESREISSDSVVRTLFSLPRARVQYLGQEPRSHKSFDLAKGENNEKNKCFLKRISMTQLFYIIVSNSKWKAFALAQSKR